MVVRRSRAGVTLCGLILLLLAGCNPQPASTVSATSSTTASASTASSGTVADPASQKRPLDNSPTKNSPAKQSASPFRLTDRAEQAGLMFVDHAPISREGHIHLYMGSGLAWCDYDLDGWPDMHVNQGTPYPNVPADKRQSNRFFRNDRGTFQDVTALAGLGDAEYSFGVTAADYNNDGFPDLFVTNFGRNALYRNNGDGTFEEVAHAAGVDTYGLPAGCTWADADGDGNLDLYVCYYLDVDPAKPEQYPVCRMKKSRDEQDLNVKAGDASVKYVTCHPRYQKASFDVLLHNLGNGRFEDVSVSAGLHTIVPAPGLGVIAADLDDDGDIDFFVANDSVENHLWENLGGLKFRDAAVSSGTAVNREGNPQACMGIGIGDIEQQGQLDLFVTNYFRETNTFYRNRGGLLFQDVSDLVGITGPSRLRLGFGANFFDPDNDGWLDLFVANGHVDDRVQAEFNRPEEPFEQLAQIFVNESGRRFRDVSEHSGAYFQLPRVGRGSAVADYDRDGKVDLAVHNLNEPMALLHNETPAVGQWVSVELIGSQSNRSGVGAKVYFRSGKKSLLRPRLAANSYLSTDEERVFAGLGSDKHVVEVVVRWPSGLVESWPNLPAGTHRKLREGTGKKNQLEVRK